MPSLRTIAGLGRDGYNSKVVVADIAIHAHQVHISDRTGHWYCNGCGKKSTSDRHMLKCRYRCVEGCNFDLCRHCYAQMQAYACMSESICQGYPCQTPQVGGLVVAQALAPSEAPQQQGQAVAKCAALSHVAPEDPSGRVG